MDGEGVVDGDCVPRGVGVAATEPVALTLGESDNALEGEAIPTPQLYQDVMESLRES